MNFMDNALRNHLVKRVALMLSLVGIVMMTGAYIIDSKQLDIRLGARYTEACGMMILGLFMSSVFFLRNKDCEQRKTAFIFYWFCSSITFNLAWQLPLDLFPVISQSEVTYSNLYKFIGWWGYGFMDLHYGTVDVLCKAVETLFVPAIILAIVGLVKLVRGTNYYQGYMYLGIAGILQSYNECMYASYDIIDGFKSVTDHHEPITWILYFGFALMWSIFPLLAGIFALQKLKKLK